MKCRATGSSCITGCGKNALFRTAHARKKYGMQKQKQRRGHLTRKKRKCILISSVCYLAFASLCH